MSRWRLRWPWYRRTEFSTIEEILTVLGIDYEHQCIRRATIVLEGQEAPIVMLEVHLGDHLSTEERMFTIVPKEKRDVESGMCEVREA